MLSSHFALFIPCIQPSEYFLFLCTFARLLACCLDFTPILQTIASYPSLSLLSFSKKFFPVPLHGTHATHSSNPTIGIGYHICQLAACSWTTGPPHGYQSSSTHFCYFLFSEPHESYITHNIDAYPTITVDLVNTAGLWAQKV